MRDDLLDAYAAVNWAVSQLDTFKGRLVSWRKDSPYKFVMEEHPEMGKNLVRLRDVKLPDPIINAELGAIINSIRSSLDILITSVAARTDGAPPEDAYFPIAKSFDHFREYRYAGANVIQRLPDSVQALIENLEPWRGGDNDFLLALHDLDNMRKHRKLIDVKPSPYIAMVSPNAFRKGFSFVHTFGGFKEDTVVAEAPPDTNYTDFHMAFDIVFDEAGFASTKPVITMIDEFAGLANSIISLFE